jgi:hypothetical protein
VLGHFIEEEGVPTACISLIRLHTEIIRPPRALWVPFDLGRPLGPPGDVAFQKRVLLALMSMFEAEDGPILEDFPEDEPETSGEVAVLSCPVDFTGNMEESQETDPLRSAFRHEMMALRPWYDMGVARRRRTTVGVSGLELEVLCDFIYSFVKGAWPENPRDDIPLEYTLKFAVEDLQSYYIEAITSQPGQEDVSGRALKKWFWDETQAAKVLLELKEVCQSSPDESMSRMAAHFIVPMEVAQSKND